MLRSSTNTYTDPDAYTAAIQPAHWKMLVSSRGTFQAELTQIKLPRLWLQRGRENLPRVTSSTVSTERPPIAFLTDPNQAALNHSGVDLPFGELMAVASGSTHHHRTESACNWATLSITHDDLATTAHALTGRDLAAPSVTRRFRPNRPLMLRLTTLHETAGRLAKRAAGIPAQTAHSLEQAILHALVMCLTERMPTEINTNGRRHLAIVESFEEILAASDDRGIYLAEICGALGVSERTLRLICHEHLGMGPIRYLWLRRMHLARAALLRADFTKSTVTEIATEFGFWELGRFSVEYRALFGEAPSASLHKQPEDTRTSESAPFIN